jgi:glycosyltransferase involved in cell wall biosynthesis
MRIVIDLQGAQTESSKRGIGRYSLAIAQAIARHRGEHDVVLGLNGLFPDTIERIRAAFNDLLPQDKVRIFEVPGPVRSCISKNSARRRRAEMIREAFLADLNPDMVLLTSLVEGYIDDGVTSIGRLTQGSWRTATILYDLIPLALPHDVFTNSAHRAWYEEKIQHFRRADLFLAISDYSRLEGVERLRLEPEQITNISTAVEDSFRPLNISNSARYACAASFGIERPFLFYAGGFDPRKNVERAIRAFAMLPAEIRHRYQFVLGGEVMKVDKIRFHAIARQAGLESEACVFTGRLDDETLIKLHNLCTAFIFPSLREGFGLPALEAMACGAPTIASNTSSLPEVIGLEEALFNPESEADISRLIGKTLGDEAFRARLREHGLSRARQFSWDKTGRRALDAIERGMTVPKKVPAVRLNRRPRLAFVSPLPPERTGIADYSAELLPALARHYEIVVIVDQKTVDLAAIGMKLPVHDPAWLRANSDAIDRVLYQMGNSPFHNYMRDLMVEVPGTLVLHDFFLSGLFSWLEQVDPSCGTWTRALYRSHGYIAVRDRYRDAEATRMCYPVNLGIVQAAQGVIVHSEHARMLAGEWLGPGFADDWRVIPQLRGRADSWPRAAARDALGLPQDAFILCSFGLIDPVKFSHRLIEAFLASSLVRDAKCQLIFVGENDGGDYGARLLEIIRASGLSQRIRITGWTDSLVFRQHLAAADLAVQVRTNSRGETSRAVLDCWNAGLPVIVNAHGSLAELPADAVWMLDDKFSNADLVTALEVLHQNPGQRDALSGRAREVIATRHAPETCARHYAEAIEGFYVDARTRLPALLDAIATTPPRPNKVECRALSQAIARSLPSKTPARQLLLDFSATIRTELKTGIERTARALTLAFLERPPDGFRIEPAYLSNEGGAWHYRYARRFTLDLLGCPPDALADDAVESQAGDLLLGVDNSGHRLIEAEATSLFADYRNRGVAVYFMVYDLLPLRLPQYFPPGSKDSHEGWLRALLKMDGALCISQAVADDLRDWAQACDRSRFRAFRVGWFHLGADTDNAAPSHGLPEDAARNLAGLGARPSFLMVGTIEPRKGHALVLDAFDRLWSRGLDVNLVIVGAEGWRHLRPNMRRTIPQTMARLRSHPEWGRRLFWVNRASDEYLEKIYATSSCLIAAAEGEGFGLPLIEAARHGLPIIARDIPVFREVAGEHAFYFAGKDSDVVAEAIKQWLVLHENGEHPKSHSIPWITWAQGVERLKEILLKGDWYARVSSTGEQGEGEKKKSAGPKQELSGGAAPTICNG